VLQRDTADGLGLVIDAEDQCAAAGIAQRRQLVRQPIGMGLDRLGARADLDLLQLQGGVLARN